MPGIFGYESINSFSPQPDYTTCNEKSSLHNFMKLFYLQSSRTFQVNHNASNISKKANFINEFSANRYTGYISL